MQQGQPALLTSCFAKQEHKYCDSLDPNREFSEISYQEMRSPEPGEEGWPRMQACCPLLIVKPSAASYQRSKCSEDVEGLAEPVMCSCYEMLCCRQHE